MNIWLFGYKREVSYIVSQPAAVVTKQKNNLSVDFKFNLQGGLNYASNLTGAKRKSGFLTVKCEETCCDVKRIVNAAAVKNLLNFSTPMMKAFTADL